jgi:hypothetical protein
MGRADSGNMPRRRMQDATFDDHDRFGFDDADDDFESERTTFHFVRAAQVDGVGDGHWAGQRGGALAC